MKIVKTYLEIMLNREKPAFALGAVFFLMKEAFDLGATGFPFVA